MADWIISRTTARQRQFKFTSAEAACAWAQRMVDSHCSPPAPHPYLQNGVTVICAEVFPGESGKNNRTLAMAELFPHDRNPRLLLSKHHCETASMAAVKDTVLHELAHFLVPLSGHDRQFRDMLFLLGARDLNDDAYHPMGYDLHIPWTQARKLRVMPRRAYTKAILEDNVRRLWEVGFFTRTHMWWHPGSKWAKPEPKHTEVWWLLHRMGLVLDDDRVGTYFLGSLSGQG
jgi:hypothetical protein